MTFCVENEIGADFPFDMEAVAKQVIRKVLEAEKCPYEVEVNLLIMRKGSGLITGSTERSTGKQMSFLFRAWIMKSRQTFRWCGKMRVPI